MERKESVLLAAGKRPGKGKKRNYQPGLTSGYTRFPLPFHSQAPSFFSYSFLWCLWKGMEVKSLFFSSSTHPPVKRLLMGRRGKRDINHPFHGLPHIRSQKKKRTMMWADSEREDLDSLNRQHQETLVKKFVLAVGIGGKDDVFSRRSLMVPQVNLFLYERWNHDRRLPVKTSIMWPLFSSLKEQFVRRPHESSLS